MRSFSSLLVSGLVAFASAAAIGSSSDAPWLYERDLSLAKRNMPGKVSTHPQVTIRGSVCTVKPLGGGRDDSSALIYAFQACSQKSLIELPGFYVVDRVLNTTLSSVEVRLTGVIQYTPNIKYWSPNSIFLTYQNTTTSWLFQGSDITLHGGGTIDGNGQVWWEQFALNANSGTAGSSTRSFARPVALTIGNAQRVKIDNISIVQSPNWSSFIYQSSYVTVSNMFFSAKSYNASAPAKNTDGMDIYRSSHITLRDWVVDNDDDCVSLKPNSTFVEMYNLHCNGSHGISIGSLGQYQGEVDIVSDVFVKNISMYNAQNGARIKVFGGSNVTGSTSGGGSGFVRNITFDTFYNQNVDNPILIDQCYFTTAAQCAAFPATLSISDVHYINVSGTSSGVVKNGTVASLQCSAPCTGITAVNTNLSPPNGTARYLCKGLGQGTSLDFPCTQV